jgi:HEAT repeat protein
MGSTRVCAFVFSVAFVVPALHAQQSFDQTLAALKSPDARARLAAVQRLTDARYPEAIGPVAPLVTDADDRVQLSAIAAELAIFAAERPSGRPSSVDAFVDAPFSVYALPVPRELTAALLALGCLGKASTPALADLLSHERASVAVRQYLLEAGATSGVLSSRLASADPRVRRGIVDVLGLVGGAGGGGDGGDGGHGGDVSAIAALQQDPDAAVRAASARALYRLKLSGKV